MTTTSICNSITMIITLTGTRTITINVIHIFINIVFIDRIITWMDPPPSIRNSKDYIRVLLYSYYTTITGWGVLLNYYYGYYGP